MPGKGIKKVNGNKVSEGGFGGLCGTAAAHKLEQFVKSPLQ